MDDERKWADLVLEGGGVLGIAHVGAVAAFEEEGYSFVKVAGASGGAIVGALVAAGMPAVDMKRAMKNVKWKEFADPGLLDRLGLVGKGASLLLEDGVYEGERLRRWLGGLLLEHGVETFADLPIDHNPEPATVPEAGREFRLVVTVADLTRGELVRLPWDYRDCFATEPASRRVVDAVRASAAVPFFYEPVRLRNTDDAESVLVDGGVLQNFPIEIFDRTDDQLPRWPTFGVKLISQRPAEFGLLPSHLALLRRGPVKLLESLIGTMIAGQDRARLDLPWISERTVEVDTGQLAPLDFDAVDTNPELREGLYESGYEAGKKFLRGWDFEVYKKTFRACPPALSGAETARA